MGFCQFHFIAVGIQRKGTKTQGRKAGKAKHQTWLMARDVKKRQAAPGGCTLLRPGRARSACYLHL
jgi:hypothetical protein